MQCRGRETTPETIAVRKCARSHTGTVAAGSRCMTPLATTRACTMNLGRAPPSLSTWITVARMGRLRTRTMGAHTKVRLMRTAEITARTGTNTSGNWISNKKGTAYAVPFYFANLASAVHHFNHGAVVTQRG